MIKCVVFDLDGTLVDVGELFYRVFKAFLEHMHLPAIGFNRKGDPWVSAYDMVVSRFPWLAKLVGGKAFGDTWEKVLIEMIRGGEVRLYVGALDVLKRLHGEGRKLCLATNTPKRFADVKLSLMGLHEYFDCVFTPQDEWGAKPSPRSLLHALDRFRLQPAELLVVGDHAQDVRYGKAAGVRTAAALYGYGNPEEVKMAGPDLLADHPTDIVRIVLGS
jgi:HAD superfamily hydrolase (TIGR01509 family)